MTGTISNIEDFGSIVVVWLSTGSQDYPVYFDHRPFQHLLEAEGTTATELVGRPARIDGETLTFQD
jgi:hypothetical protein